VGRRSQARRCSGGRRGDAGYWMLAASTLVGEAGSVYAFEPVPSTAAMLQNNISASNARNVEIVQTARRVKK
jgi:FkbM family methyltransferase